MEEELDKQFYKVATLLLPDGDAHLSMIEMRKLMRMFYEYLKEYRE